MATSEGNEEESFWKSNWIQMLLRERLDDSKLTVSSLKVRPFPIGEEKAKTKLELVTVFRADDGDEDEICELFSKRITADLPHISALRDEWAFEKEAGFYTSLLGHMSRYSRMHAEYVEIPFHFFPKWYAAKSDPGEELVLLDSLLWLGYTSMPPKPSLTRRHCKLVFEALATVHAISYAMHRNSEIDLIGKYGFLKNRLLCPERRTVYDTIMQSYFKLVMNVVKDTQAANKLKQLEPRFFDILEDTSDLGGYIFVVCHGDCLTKNLFFQYGVKKNPTKLKIVDFQSIMCASPNTDLSFFLFTSTTSVLRRRYLADLLELYQTTFDRCLSSLGMATHFCCIDGLTEDFYKTLIYGFFLACTIVPEYFLKGSAPTYEHPGELEDKIKELECCEEFKNWAIETVTEVDEYGTLDFWIDSLKLY